MFWLVRKFKVSEGINMIAASQEQLVSVRPDPVPHPVTVTVSQPSSLGPVLKPDKRSLNNSANDDATCSDLFLSRTPVSADLSASNNVISRQSVTR